MGLDVNLVAFLIGLKKPSFLFIESDIAPGRPWPNLVVGLLCQFAYQSVISAA